MNATQLKTVLLALEKLSFSKASDRTSAKEMLGSLNDDCPYDLNRRFPVSRVYVYRDDMDWNNKFTKIAASLSSGDSHQNRNVDDSQHQNRQQATEQKGAASSSREFADSLTAYYNMIRTMRNQLVNREGTWTRAKFEAVYAWAEYRVPEEELSIGILVNALGLVAPERVRFGNTTARLSQPGWPGVVNTRHLDDVGENPALPADGSIVVFFGSRAAGHRPRVRIRISGETWIPIDFEVVASAD